MLHHELFERTVFTLNNRKTKKVWVQMFECVGMFFCSLTFVLIVAMSSERDYECKPWTNKVFTNWQTRDLVQILAKEFGSVI